MSRESIFSANGVYTEGMTGGTATLERSTRAQEIAPQDDRAEEVERRRRNLERLLNYEVYEERDAVEEAPVVSQTTTVAPEASVNEEDIRPSTTTMQFGDGEVEEMFNEMPSETEEKSSYKLTLRGKIAIALYSVAVVIIMALIVLNTGVLAKLSSSTEIAQAELNALSTQVEMQQAEIASISDDAYVLENAQKLGMKLGE